ncbi:hypothetical protein FAZ69_10580 [Trinickia terrae]|uniref:Uncharacterized protein n=1 Tax=Trinickia terrae TaxID=2571161 RepID=A0A4U1I7I3_9BURK|nr:hypothetical protein [Trinickia terrae]TKC89382.1 hypothetical protein FAZ69_10580 [Trinickia terrae]
MNLLWYWLVEPHRGGLNDTGRNAGLTQDVTFHDGSHLDVAVYLDEHAHPHFVRVRAFDAVDIYDTARFLDHVSVLAEHMLSVLKVTWSERTAYVPLSFFCQEAEDGTGASMLLQDMGERVFACDAARSLFVHTMEARQSLRLITDSLDPGIPAQYRYLSLYKFLEIRYRNDKDHWDWDALEAACAPQLEQFAALKLDRDLRGELEHLRDSCAHIKSGKGNKRRLGVTALHPKARRELERFMPIMAEICRAVFNADMAGKVELNQLTWTPGLQKPSTPQGDAVGPEGAPS